MPSVQANLTQKTKQKIKTPKYNRVAQLLTRTKRRGHISPVLAALHWLPELHL